MEDGEDGIYSLKLSRVGKGVAQLTSVDTQEKFILHRRKKNNLHLMDIITECAALNDNGVEQTLPQPIADQIFSAISECRTQNQLVYRQLQFEYPSQPNFIYVQDPQNPYVLDCSDIEKIVSRKILVKKGKVEKKFLLELLIPPKDLHMNMITDLSNKSLEF